MLCYFIQVPIPMCTRGVWTTYPNATYSMLVFSSSSQERGVKHFVWDLSVHICIHEEKHFCALLYFQHSPPFYLAAYWWCPQPTWGTGFPNGKLITCKFILVQFTLTSVAATLVCGDLFMGSFIPFFRSCRSFFRAEILISLVTHLFHWNLWLFAVSCQGSGRVNEV